jgi:hypothetical protein
MTPSLAKADTASTRDTAPADHPAWGYSASLPVIDMVTAITGVIIGMVVFDEPLASSPPGWWCNSARPSRRSQA